MSGGSNEVQATFWLLNAPTSLVALSETQPDGVGLGTFNPDGTAWVYRKPVAANRSQTFIADAHEVRSRTFLAHIRHATAAEPTIENTHPFEQHGRLFAHNGVLGDLPALRERLGRLRLVTMGRSFHWMDRAATLRDLDRGYAKGEERICAPSALFLDLGTQRARLHLSECD
jgi:glutamine amidotransferase